VCQQWRALGGMPSDHCSLSRVYPEHKHTRAVLSKARLLGVQGALHAQEAQGD